MNELYSQNKKGKRKKNQNIYQINSDTGKWQTTLGEYRPGSNQTLGSFGLLSATGSLLSCEALRGQCLGIRCGDPNQIFSNAHLFSNSLFTFWIKLVLLKIFQLLNYCFNLPEWVLYLQRSTWLALCRAALKVHAYIFFTILLFWKIVLQI